MARALTPAESDLLCERCGYVLNGLPPDARCPECGTPAVDSDPSRRRPPAWEDHAKPAWLRFLTTTRAVMFRPAAFFRTLSTRSAADRSGTFGRLHWAVASVLFGVAAFCHIDRSGGTDNPLAGPWYEIVGGTLLLGGLSYGFLVLLTRLAARLTTWEATYRGLRLPVGVVRRGMHFHAAHYLPVALVAAVTVVGYHALLARGVFSGLAALPYLYVLSGEVVVGAIYLFWTYWIGMRNTMYANA